MPHPSTLGLSITLSSALALSAGGCDEAAPQTCALNGKTYTVGDTIPSGRADCELACRCTGSGLECPDIGCPAPQTADGGHTEDSGPEQDSGQTEDGGPEQDGGAPKSCAMGDSTVAPGASVPCPDGCNACRCVDDTLWSGTTVACLKPPPSITPCTAAGAEAASRVTALYRAGDVLALAADTRSCAGVPGFGLCWEGFAESSPVQVKLRVTAVDVSCPVETLREVFDLAPLRAAYTSAYGSEHGELTLRLRDDTVVYGF